MSNTTTSAFRGNDPVLVPPTALTPLERLNRLEKIIETLQKDLEHQKNFNSILLDIQKIK
jgi:hypothetical protein